MAVYGRSKPYTERGKTEAPCGRCGIAVGQQQEYCGDCKRPARQLGWTD